MPTNSNGNPQSDCSIPGLVSCHGLNYHSEYKSDKERTYTLTAYDTSTKELVRVSLSRESVEHLARTLLASVKIFAVDGHF